MVGEVAQIHRSTTPHHLIGGAVVVVREQVVPSI